MQQARSVVLDEEAIDKCVDSPSDGGSGILDGLEWESRSGYGKERMDW